MSVQASLTKRQIATKFWFGDVVYLRVRDERIKGMVTGVGLSPDSLVYYVTWANAAQELRHYEIELTDEFEQGFE